MASQTMFVGSTPLEASHTLDSLGITWVFKVNWLRILVNDFGKCPGRANACSNTTRIGPCSLATRRISQQTDRRTALIFLIRRTGCDLRSDLEIIGPNLSAETVR